MDRLLGSAASNRHMTQLDEWELASERRSKPGMLPQNC